MIYDAVIVGGGHNGLVTGIYLAKAGWKVLVLERQSRAGGAVHTAELTLPGFRHDRYATNLNLFAGSPFYQEFKQPLEAHGLRFVPVTKPFCSLFPDDSHLAISTDLDASVESFARFSQHDAEAWKTLATAFPQTAATLFPLLGEAMPSWGAIQALYRGWREGGNEWLLETTRLLMSSSAEFADAHFEDPRSHALLAAWGMHLAFAPEMAGGALFSYLECMSNQAFGMVLGEHGADNLSKALVSLFQQLGGELILNAEVTSIEVDAGRARGVRVGEQRYAATKAVIANITPKILFGHLVGAKHLPKPFMRKIGEFRYGVAALMVHLALDELPRWQASDEVRLFNYVHIGPYATDMTRAHMEASAGLLPADPLLVIAQPTVADPSRAPAGKHILWVQVRSVPTNINADALGQINTTDWASVKDAYADRVVEKISRYAPGFEQHILARAVDSPLDIEAANPNLVGGDSLSGEHTLRQNFLFRPVPGWSRYKTPIKDLYIVGASTWPGAGVGAGSGRLLGKMLT